VLLSAQRKVKPFPATAIGVYENAVQRAGVVALMLAGVLVAGVVAERVVGRREATRGSVVRPAVSVVSPAVPLAPVVPVARVPVVSVVPVVGPEVDAGTPLVHAGPWARRAPRAGIRRCRQLLHDDGAGHFLAMADLEMPEGVLLGTGLGVPVSRRAGWGLDVDDVPDDLVDARTRAPRTVAQCYPPGGQCLRRSAAEALDRLSRAMQAVGITPHIHSAFRSYEAQCATFLAWAFERGQGFCEATEGSALPGHSQHQLGTAVDLFSASWAARGPVMRPGFGCSSAGRWLASEAWRYGFVLPYPPPHRDGRADPCAISNSPDPRTGYQYEPWHLQYVGEPMAAAYHTAFEASGQSLAFEGWQRQVRGDDDDAGLPVCDGCACGWCSTLTAPASRGPCRDRALRLDADGNARVDPTARPTLDAVTIPDPRTVTATLTVPSGVVTTTPVADGDLVNLPVYPSLPGTWRLVVEDPSTGRAYRVALVSGRPPGWVNGASRRLPTTPGTLVLRLRVPGPGAWRARLESQPHGAAQHSMTLSARPPREVSL